MLQTVVKTGSAAVSRTAQRNPMEIVIGLIEEDPTADADRLFSKWLPIIRGDDDLLIPALRHTFTNMLSCVDRDRRKQRPTLVREARQAAAQQVERVKEQIVQIVLMNLTLPNGKLLRDAKFKDCAKAGGWFAKVAKMGKPDQVVGRTISEQQLRAMKLT